MRVLFFPHYRRNPYQRELARGLAALGVEVEMHPGLPPMDVPGEPRPDLLHVHWTQQLVLAETGAASLARGFGFLARLAAARRRGIGVVWTVHNLVNHEKRHAALDLFFSRRLVRLCDQVIVHCEHARQEVTRLYRVPPERRQRVHAVPHGHYLGSYPRGATREEAREALGLEAGAFVMLYFGRIRDYKGVPQLLNAFRAQGEPGGRLMIVGRPATEALEAELRRLSGEDPRVELVLGFVPARDVQLYLRAADVLVLPFGDVLTSGSALLGMSFGKPVVAPRLGCLPEVLGPEGALLYDAADPEGLSRALREARSADLEAMGRRNQARALELGWDRVASETYQVYRRALGGALRARGPEAVSPAPVAR